MEGRIEIGFAKIYDDVKIPNKEDYNAGYDIYARFEEPYLVISPHETITVPTGLVSKCPENYYFQLFERGSTGTKGMGQRSGCIDSSYRGQWFCPITNHNNQHLVIVKNTHIEQVKTKYGSSVIIYPYEKAICQAVLLPVPYTKVIEYPLEEIILFKTRRMDGCLGSSNK